MVTKKNTKPIKHVKKPDVAGHFIVVCTEGTDRYTNAKVHGPLTEKEANEFIKIQLASGMKSEDLTVILGKKKQVSIVLE